MAAVV